MYWPSWKAVAALAVSALVLAGCATMNVSSYAVRGADFRQYRTFNWGPADTFSTGDPRLDNNTFFQERVQTDIEKELTARGFEKRESGTPDLMLHYHASVTQRIDVAELDRQYGYADGSELGPTIYDAGTLTIDFVDTRTKRIVWRGWAEGSLEGVIDNQEWLNERVEEAVARILQRFPRTS